MWQYTSDSARLYWSQNNNRSYRSDGIKFAQVVHCINSSVLHYSRLTTSAQSWFSKRVLHSLWHRILHLYSLIAVLFGYGASLNSFYVDWKLPCQQQAKKLEKNMEQERHTVDKDISATLTISWNKRTAKTLYHIVGQSVHKPKPAIISV